MAKIKGLFYGVVTQMDDQSAQVLIDSISQGNDDVTPKAKIGDTVTVLKSDFMKQMPYPAQGSHVGGSWEQDLETGHEQYLNLVRPV